MTESEAINKHIDECNNRIENISFFMDSNSDANKEECCNNIEILQKVINALEKQMTKKVDKTEIEISKRKFATELKQLVHQKCAEINHYVSGCNSPFSYLQIADVQESLREIENTLNIKIRSDEE